MSVKLACAAWNWHDLLFHPPTGKLKTFMNFTSSFCLFIFVWINKLYKQFYDNILYSPFRELVNINLKMQNTKFYCYMTGENPVSWLAQFVFINLYVYLESGLNRFTS